MDTQLDHHDRSITRLDGPDVPEALLCHSQLTAMDFLERCVRDCEPLAALAGEAGTGKTTVLDAALARRDRAGDRIIRARNFPAGPLSLHRALTAALGVVDAGALSAEQLEQALRRALAEAGEATPPVLAVDNAHSLPPETLRYLSLLAGLREAGRPLFRILLVGRSGFTTPQATPVQLTLEPIHPAAARQVVEQRLAAAEMTLEDGAVQAIVRDAKGNLGRLDALLRARIEQARPTRLRRLLLAATHVSGAVRSLLAGGQPRWQDTLAAAAALLAVSIATAAIGYQSAGPHRPYDKTAAAASPAAVPPSPQPQTHDIPPAALVSPPQAAAVVPPVVAPLPAMLTPLPTTAPEPQPLAPPSAVESMPPKQAEVAASIALAAQVPIAPTDAGQALVASLAPRPLAARFRVNNVSSCHHGVCPRWSVTEIDRHVHYFAAFDPAPLHLDHDTLQRLRQGALEITVTGTVKKRGPDGQTLVAETLQSMTPHHNRRPPATELAAAPDHSPPPAFLPLPEGNRAAGDAQAPDPPVDPEQ